MPNEPTVQQNTMIRQDDVIRMVDMTNINLIYNRLERETQNVFISASRLRRYALQIAVLVQEDIERYGESRNDALSGILDCINFHRNRFRREYYSDRTDIDLMGVAITHFENELEWAIVPSVPSDERSNEDPCVSQPSTLTYQAYKQSVVKKRITAAVRDDINDNCPICLESFKLSRIVHKTSCGHHFHPRCLKHFICKVGPNKCPVCRTCIEPTSVSHTQ